MSQFVTVVNPKGVEMEVDAASLPSLLKKGFLTKQDFDKREVAIPSTEEKKWVYVANQHGVVHEVESSRLKKLLSKGYTIASQGEYTISSGANAEDVEWNLPTRPNYRYDGYGRLVSYVAEKFKPNPASNKHLIFGQPREIERDKDSTYVLFSMFEANRIPHYWADCANKYFDHIIVPSEFSKEVFIKSGVKTPITIIPLFATHFTPYEPGTSPFTFSMQNAMVDGAQKGWDLVIRSFLTLFRGKKDVRLILKARNHDWAHSLWYEEFLEKEENIELIKGDWQYNDMHTRLYAQTNCFVFPSRGEGWGLPPLEAMAHGIPTILTKAHSHTEFSRFGIEIDTVGESFSYYIGRVKEAGIGRWVEPDFEQLVDAMRDVYKNYSEHKKRSMDSIKEIEKLFNGELFLKRLKSFMDSV